MPAGKLVLAKKARPSKNKQYVTKAQLYKAIHNNIENKFLNNRMITYFGSVGSGTWTEEPIAIPPQGDDRTQRIGNQITLKSLEIRGILANGSSQSAIDDPYNVIRLVIGLWDGADVSPLGTWPMDQPIRKTYNQQGLMKKFYDKFIPLNVTTVADGDGYAPHCIRFKYFKYWKKGIKINFADDGILKPDKQLVISMISDSAAIPHPGFINGYWILTYEDA